MKWITGLSAIATLVWVIGCANDSRSPTGDSHGHTVTPFVSLTAGGSDTCGLSETGAVHCWGESYGSSPVAVAVGVQFTLLTGGGYGPICGLTSAGLAHCLGGATPGGAKAEGWTFSALAATADHACGVTTTGAAYCWGSDWMGQLGDSAIEATNHQTPVAVYGGLTFNAVATGFWTSCGLTSDGAAYCWGHNSEGELGIGTARGPCFWIDFFTGEESDNCSTIPVPVAGGLSFTSLTAGFLHTCGLTTAGAAYCWGSNGWGMLGNNCCSSSTPRTLSGDLTFVALVSGWQHTCAITNAGEAYCWGLNEYGQLGIGSTMPASEPLSIVGALRFKAIAPGDQHTCGLTGDGVAYCWGDNTYGQLGNGSSTSSLIPVPVAPF